MKLFKYFALSLLCFTRSICGVSLDENSSQPVEVKFPKSFYQSHSADVLGKAVSPKIVSNSVADGSSRDREISNEGEYHEIKENALTAIEPFSQ